MGGRLGGVEGESDLRSLWIDLDLLKARQAREAPSNRGGLVLAVQIANAEFLDRGHVFALVTVSLGQAAWRIATHTTPVDDGAQESENRTSSH